MKIYYTKLLNSKIETYTYDDWFNEYTYKNFGEVYPDFDIIRTSFFQKYNYLYHDINPKQLYFNSSNKIDKNFIKN